MSFINENFLLQSKTAQRLYHTYAAAEPILDYHCHLSAHEIAINRRFNSLHEIWLDGDHYKWRAMRTNGIPELYCTGAAPAYEKFLAWARTVPATLRNPLYHWTHLELKRYFSIENLLDESTAPGVWEKANSLLASKDLSVHGILQRFRVRAICTSDDPADSLEAHRDIAASDLETRVYPTFRPDGAANTADPVRFNRWVDRLSASANLHIADFNQFRDALTRRHDDFHEIGCRLSDHGLNHCYTETCTEEEASSIFSRLRSGKAIGEPESNQFAAFLMLFFGHLDAEKGWTKQLHLGANRDVNLPMVKTAGPYAGFDSIGDLQQVRGLVAYLGRLEQEKALPKMVLYNANPADNYAFATLTNNFHDSSTPAKLQFGSAWWFLDQKEGIESQLNALSNTGLLSRFVGMLTDSRSFMSFPRHEYFRRIMCNLLGHEMEAGLLPNEEELVGNMVRNVCFGNAAAYFGLELSRKVEPALASALQQ